VDLLADSPIVYVFNCARLTSFVVAFAAYHHAKERNIAFRMCALLLLTSIFQNLLINCVVLLYYVCWVNGFLKFKSNQQFAVK